MAAIVAMFVVSIRTITILRVNMIDSAASVVVLMLASVVVVVREVVRICISHNVAVAVLCVNFHQVIVVEGLHVSAIAVSVVNVDHVISLVDIHCSIWERRRGRNFV